MVLSIYCVSFFAPPGRKKIHEELNIIDEPKSYALSRYLEEPQRFHIARKSFSKGGFAAPEAPPAYIL
jgi:hypothetical protein